MEIVSREQPTTIGNPFFGALVLVPEQNEVWKSVPGFAKYEVSDCGNVRRAGKLKNLKQFLSVDGYAKVKLCEECIADTFTVSRLVALAFIPNPENKPIVDHINGDKNNNSKSNLRWATLTENAHNKRKHCNNTTGFKGVSPHKTTGKFQVHISIDGVKTHLGLYKTKTEAYGAYCEAARKYYKAFAAF